MGIFTQRDSPKLLFPQPEPPVNKIITGFYYILPYLFWIFLLIFLLFLLFNNFLANLSKFRIDIFSINNGSSFNIPFWMIYY